MIGIWDIKKARLVYWGLFLLIIKNFFDVSDIIPYTDTLDNAISVCILLIFCMVMIKEKYSLKYLIIYLLVSMIALYSAYITGYKIIVVTVLTILAIRQESINEVAKFIFGWKVLLLSINTILAFLLAIVDLADIGGYFEEGTRFRIHFGYGLPGHFADYVLDLIVLWVWINFKNIKKSDYIKLFFVTLVTYICTDSRTVFAVSLLLIVGVFLIKKTRKIDWLLRLTSSLIVPLLTAFMFCMIWLFAEKNVFAYIVDSLLNTRVRLNGYSLEQFGITWFGQNCMPVSNSYSMTWISNGGAFDNVYMWLCINMGIIWLILIAVCFYFLASKRQPIINLLIIVWALGAMTDTDFLNGVRSFSILLITLIFTSKRDIGKSIEGQ